MTEEKKTPARRKPSSTPEVDKSALAILFTAYMKKGYNQAMAVQTAKAVYKELFDEPN